MSYTAEYKRPYEGGYVNRPDKTTPEMAEFINNRDDVIMKIESYLANTIKNDFAQLAEAGYSLGLDIDENYVMTISLKNKAGTVISSKEIDFPIESMIINATYSEDTKILTLSLQNGQTLEVNISSIISGLVPDARMIAGIDLKDDITAEELKEALAVPGKTSELENDAGFMTKDDFIPSDSVVEMGEIKPWLYDTSGEEVIVGVYGGKPLYRKVLKNLTATSTTNNDISFEHGIENVETIQVNPTMSYIEGIPFHGKVATYPVNYVSVDGNEYSWSAVADNTHVTLRAGTDRSSLISGIVFTLEYTKTTDTEGSGEDLMPYGLVQSDFATTDKSYIPNSKAGGLSIERIAGGVKQNRYEGKQLIPTSTFGTANSIGVTATVNEDGTVSVSGTSSAEKYSSFGLGSVTGLIDGESYTFSDENLNSTDSYTMALGFKDGSWVKNLSTQGEKSTTFTWDAELYDEIQIVLRVLSGITVDAIAKPMLQLGTEATEWEPYVGGVTSPNLDYPQDIQNVDITEVKSENKNIIPYPYYESSNEDNGLTWADLGNGEIIAYGTYIGTSEYSWFYLAGSSANVKIPAGTYTLTGCPNGGGSGIYYVRLSLANGVVKSDIGKGVTFTITEDTVITSLACVVHNNLPVSMLTFNPQLELSPVATEYEPYKSSTASFAFTARAIEVSVDDDYTYEKDGKYYVADTVQRTDEGYQLVQRIGEGVFDGSSEENWWKSSGNITVDEFTLVLDGFKAPYSNMLCSHFVYDRDSNEIGTFRNYCSDSWIYPHQVYFMFSEYGTTTIEVFKEWLSSNPITIHYILAEPITIPLSDADAIALLSLKTFDEATRISTNSVVEPVIDVKYGTSEVGAKTLNADNTALRAEIRAKALEATVVDNI